MNTKVLLAFLAGALAASGVYFVQSHRQSAAAPAIAATPVPDPPPLVAVPAPEPAPEPVLVKAPSVKTIAPKKIAKAAPEPVEPVETPISSVAPAPPEPTPVPSVLSTPAPEPAAPVAPPPPPEPVASKPEPPQPRSVTLASGTVLNIRLGETLASNKNVAGDSFVGTLDQPLVVDGLVIAERGAHVNGRVRDIEQAGRVKGLARLVLELTSFNTSDGQRITIRTAGFESLGPESKKEDAEKIGAGAAIGAIIGAIAGGGKGAAIGTAAGGAAGGGAVAATRGKPAVLSPETRVSFRLDQPVTITERI